jgi:hypothetical protein
MHNKILLHITFIQCNVAAQVVTANESIYIDDYDIEAGDAGEQK